MEYFENMQSTLIPFNGDQNGFKRQSSTQSSRILKKSRLLHQPPISPILFQPLIQQREKLFFGIIIKICESANLHFSTFSLALEMFDRLSSENSIPIRFLPRFGLISLVLASKMCEPRCNFLILADVEGFFSGNSLEIANQTEKAILRMLNFDLNLRNRFDLLRELMADDQFRFLLPAARNQGNLMRFESFAKHLLLITFRHPEFRRFSELKIACMILMLTRQVMKIPVSWPCDLIKITGFSRIDLEDCSNLLQTPGKLKQALY